jgi:hypothetical protein
LWCATRLWTLYGGSPRHLPRVYGLALLWMPTFITLRMGQVSPLILLGIVGFMVASASRRDFTAGLFLSLIALKPQLVAPLAFAVLLWAAFERRWRVLAGAAAALAVASGVAMATNPVVFAQYVDSMRWMPPSLAFESPNAATILRRLIDPARTWPQYIPTLIAAVFVAVRWHRRRHAWLWTQELPGLLILSCLVTAYGGWTFDLLVLLVPIVAVAAGLVRSRRPHAAAIGAIAFVLISGAAYLLNRAGAPEASFIWMTPAVGLSAVVVGFLNRQPSRHVAALASVANS